MRPTNKPRLGWWKNLRHLPDWSYLTGMLVLGAIVRFVGISKSSIWHDEGYTMMMAPLPPAEIWYRTGLDVHPPLYYLTLHYWMQVFGDSEVAVRSLSVVLMLGVIIFGFLLVRRLFSNRAARLAALFLALAPFLVRYSQEARMYGMLAFFAALSTYLLVRAWQNRRWRDWLLYALAIAGGLYTYYYVIFLIVFHWAYVAFLAIYPRLSKKSLLDSLLNKQWIVANALAVILWLPWIPTAYVQLTQVQSPPWIPKATLQTMPATLGQFTIYNDMGGLYFGLPLQPLRTLLFILVVALLGVFLWHYRRNAAPAMLIILYFTLTPVLVWALSFGDHPKYVDRYFVFAATAYYAFLGILFSDVQPWRDNKIIRTFSVSLAVVLFSIGIYSVFDTNTHQMRQITEIIRSNSTRQDVVIAGDFYTFFDTKYYNGKRSPVKVFVPHDFPGCCEGKSLLFDQPQYIVRDYREVTSESGYVWVVGRPGNHDYFDNIPSNWRPVGDRFERRTLATQRYQINP